jgi:hypothetical protein
MPNAAENREVINRCFETVAESDIDLTSAVYSHFTETLPEATQHIGYMDERMRGRMLDQIYALLLDEVDADYLAFEARTHQGYGADTGQYRGILTAVKAAVCDVLGELWSSREEDAWEQSINRIVGKIESVTSA